MEKWLRVLRGKFLPILILSMLFSLTTIAQRTKRDTTRQLMPVNAEGYTYSNGHYQNSFGIPTDTIKLRYRDKDSGYIAIKNGVFYKWDGFNWPAISGGGLSTVGVATANGFGGTSSGGTTPVLTLTTPLTGILKGNGTAMLAAVPGTDFVTIPQLGTKVDSSYKTHLALPLSLRLVDTTLQISKATTSTDGYLSSVDWNTFNGKENNLGNPSTNGYVLSSTTGGVRSWIAPATGGGGGTWGSITGTLSSQTDLQSALNGKQATLGFTPYNATNPSGYISSYTETDPIVKAINGIVKSNGTTISAATAGTDYVIPSGSITGNAATVTTNANLTGPVTSTGNATAIGTGAISNTMLANSAVALLSGTNSGDNATNTQYSGLVTNANHTGDATGSTVLTLATVNSNVGTFNSLTVNAKGLVTAASNVASGGTTDYQTQTATAGQISFPFTSVPASYNDYWLDINSAVIPQSYYTNSSGVITFT
jgi:hypothetical protein